VADESKFGKKPGSTLKCEEWEALLTDALDGLLPAREAASFTAHSETCANCGDLLAHAKQGQEWLGYLHAEPEIPAGLIGKILEQTVGAGSVPLPVIAAGAGGGAVAVSTPWRRNFHETRLLMTIAMAFFSIALTLDLAGIKPGNFRLSDLRPSQISSALSRQYFGAQKQVVHYYYNLRFMYQLQSRMRELRRNVESQPQQQPSNQKQQEQQKPSGTGNKDGLLNDAPERGGVLNARQGSEHKAESAELRAQSSAQGEGYRVQGTEQRAANEGTEVRVSEGTGRSISLGQSRTGLEEAAEAAAKVEGSLV
jgi:hypothetical protein